MTTPCHVWPEPKLEGFPYDGVVGRRGVHPTYFEFNKILITSYKYSVDVCSIFSCLQSKDIGKLHSVHEIFLDNEDVFRLHITNWRTRNRPFVLTQVYR